jgi:phosphoglycolate phosphatase-like HAD superfamily hydrolase
MIRAIFFDFDGTISDTHSFISKTFIEILEKEEYFVDKSKINSIMGEKFQHMLKDLGIVAEIDSLRKKFYNLLIQRTKKEKLKPCVSLAPLKTLSKKYPLVIISNAETIFTKMQAKKFGIINLFKEIRGAETFETKDKIMKQLFKKYKLNPKEVIYIGDRFSDVEYAKKAGCWAVAIHNKCSWSTRKIILAEHPDFIVKDFYGLERVIEKINSI